jgi:hypothetical protein
MLDDHGAVNVRGLVLTWSIVEAVRFLDGRQAPAQESDNTILEE